MNHRPTITPAVVRILPAVSPALEHMGQGRGRGVPVRRLRACLTSLAIVMALVATVSCARTEDEDNWWDGSAPFKERQSIQAYQEVVETRLGEFVAELAPSSGGTSLISPSELSPCKGGGYELYTASITFELPVEYSRARELAGRLFPTIGLDTITNDDEDSVFFHDKTNGGDIDLIISMDGSVTISGVSGCRPSRDGTDPRTTRTPPEWEASLPLYQYPSHTPKPTHTPAPATSILSPTPS